MSDSEIFSLVIFFFNHRLSFFMQILFSQQQIPDRNNFSNFVLLPQNYGFRAIGNGLHSQHCWEMAANANFRLFYRFGFNELSVRRPTWAIKNFKRNNYLSNRLAMKFSRRISDGQFTRSGNHENNCLCQDIV